ncbi:uncharacterized protein LOC120743327 [Simochromis diagramma]|uniref:uncharacterized protein LOC120743327 n=1 Tax=Simochromis diagramma TaxID=43689 RepID=UPI001A7E69AD|nr:uncharacterized protein LOC120743327 [Simochromis diagramma]
MDLDSELKEIATEMKHLSLKRGQLKERKNILCIFQELRNRAEFGQTEEAVSTQKEIEIIDEKLKELNEKQSELQKNYDNMLNAAKNKQHKKVVSFTDKENIDSVAPPSPPPGSNIVYVVAPPTIPAPEVVLELDKLPAAPCRTQCPECRQFITTETFSSVSSVTWLVCIMTALVGGVAGCCLIPFCMDRFKSTNHRCPKCRTLIKTIKKL